MFRIRIEFVLLFITAILSTAVYNTLANPSDRVSSEVKPVIRVKKEPFNVTEACRRQQEAAKTIKQPVEFTNSIGMKFKLIPAGSFMMGSPRDEKHRNDDEGPVHQVQISKPYYLGVHEITQGEFTKVMGTKPWHGEENVKEEADYAASCITWDEAVEFCKKLSAKEGRTYRLPTEAEWEHACRTGSKTTYNFGNSRNDLSQHAWWGGVVGNGNCKEEQYAQRVGQKLPNAWGLYDTHGNVNEWCVDWHGKDYYKKSPTIDPTGPTSGSDRVSRGGGWDFNARSCRSAFRFGNTPNLRLSFLGFRVVLVPTE